MFPADWRPRKKARTARRYGKLRWRRVSDKVLGKTKVQRLPVYQCWRPGCYRMATVADHIEPVTPDTPDAMFYAEWNLRPSCRPCNLARAAYESEDESPRSRVPGGTITFRSKPRIG